jgi:hypothetical protein
METPERSQDNFEEDADIYFHEPCVRCLNRLHKEGSAEYKATCGTCIHI